MGDDAAGPWVVEHLRAEYDLGPGVSVSDLGTPGLDLAPHLSGARVIVLVDTVKSDGPPERCGSTARTRSSGTRSFRGRAPTTRR
jgi:hydrogenase maturation protease